VCGPGLQADMRNRLEEYEREVVQLRAELAGACAASDTQVLLPSSNTVRCAAMCRMLRRKSLVAGLHDVSVAAEVPACLPLCFLIQCI
jgi:hypothetical protein